jgi:hypothetical protein
VPQAHDNLTGKPFASNRQPLSAKPGKPLHGEPLSASGQRRSTEITVGNRDDPERTRPNPPFCRGLCFPGRAVRSAQIGLFCKLLAGCSFTVGVVTSCWKGGQP